MVHMIVEGDYSTGGATNPYGHLEIESRVAGGWLAFQEKPEIWLLCVESDFKAMASHSEFLKTLNRS